MDDDELEAAAATPESEKLASSMAAREYLQSPEGEMFQSAAAALSDARLRTRDALDALTGLAEPGGGGWDCGPNRPTRCGRAWPRCATRRPRWPASSSA